MDLEIFKENLEKSLNIIELITRKNINLPILNNILIETEKNFLKISATNLESSIIWRILTKIKKQGKVCLSASFFKNLISFTKQEKINLVSENNNLIIETINQKNQIQGVNPEEFPIIPKIKTDNFFIVNNKDLTEGLSQIINIPSLSQIKPEISGIYFYSKKDKLFIVSTDSFRLAEKNIPLKNKTKDFSFIIPQGAAKELLNILSIQKQDLKVFFTEKQVLFEWLGEETNYPQIQFSTRLIEGEYPNYQEIIPKKYIASIILQKDIFSNQIKKAGLFSNKTSEIKITLLSNKNQIKIFSQNPDIGKNESFLDAKLEVKNKEELEVSFNYKFLLDGINNIKSSEIKFNLSENDGPASITPVNNENYIYILMPIKSI